MEIRTAGKEELPALIALYGQLDPANAALSVAQGEQIVSQLSLFTGSAIFLGFEGYVLVTSCTLIVVPNLTRNGAPYALIENVVTDVGHRQRGHGRAILKAAISAAWENNCYKIMLLSGSQNPDTLKFYLGTGFAQSKTGFQIRRPL